MNLYEMCECGARYGEHIYNTLTCPGNARTRTFAKLHPSSRVCELCSPRDYKAMRLLESLTPNGSEFVNDPEACVEFVRYRLGHVIDLAKQRNKLRAVMEALPLAEFPDNPEDCDASLYVDNAAAIFEAIRLAKEILKCT